jgi:tetratricopeptide (TPR) repeat protein
MRGAALLIGVLIVTSGPARPQELSVARAAANVDAEIPWITDHFMPGDPGGPVPQLPKAAVDRAGLLDEALKRAGDEKKLVLWYIPRIEGIQMYRPALLDDYMRVVAFTNPWITRLVTSRFVPLRMAVPKSLFERTGIKNVDWVEPAIAILDKDGKVLHRIDRIRTFNADFFRHTLLDVLRRNADKAPLPEAVKAAVDAAVERPDSAFEASRAAFAAGDDEGARRIAKAVIERGANDRLKAHGQFLLAVVERLARNATAAGEALAAAEKLAGDDAEIKGLIVTERGLIALATGDVDAAKSAFADASGMSDNPRRSEAMYLLGIAHTLSRGFRKAEAAFRTLVATAPDSPYAAQAAANLLVSRDTTPLGPAVHAFEDPLWPPAEVFASPRANTAIERTPEAVDDAVKRAIAFLLRRQHDNGGFQDSRYAYWSTPRILPNTWVAITAVVLAGLNDWRDVDPEAIDKAVERGEKYLFNPKFMAPGQNEECYADAFKLFYLKRRLARLAPDSKDATKAREHLNETAKGLVGQQSETGFFAHEYPNPFTTAAVLVSLKQAQDHGAAVPASVFELGAKGLKSVRGNRGSFAYGEGRPSAKDNDESLKNAMARMPICERALLLAAETQDTAALEAALDHFWNLFPRFERVRTCDFHTDGELAGFFFWHGVFFTSEAIKALPPEKRAVHQKRLVEQVMKIGEMDGSFVDSHEIGKSYGSGMALMVLRNAMESSP